MEQLDITNVRELEDLLITECFYAQLLKGKLDQCERCLHVSQSETPWRCWIRFGCLRGSTALWAKHIPFAGPRCCFARRPRGGHGLCHDCPNRLVLSAASLPSAVAPLIPPDPQPFARRLRTSENVLADLESKVMYAAEKAAEAQAQRAAIEARIEEDKRLLKVCPPSRALGMLRCVLLASPFTSPASLRDLGTRLPGRSTTGENIQ